MTHIWKPIIDVITDPSDFTNKEVNICNNYCLIKNNTASKLDKSLFPNCTILDSVYKNNIMYVLVKSESMKLAKQLQSSFIVKGMSTLPDFYDNRTYETISYIITVQIPCDNITYTFSQTLPVICDTISQ